MIKYKDKTLSINERVDDLLSRMTLQEKVGQLNQHMYGWNAYEKTSQGYRLTDAFKAEVAFGDGMGALYGLFRADPWSAVTYENGLRPHDNASFSNQIQRYVIENTRLGIPVLLSEECPHGHQALDGTLIPTNIGVGSTWNPQLMEEAYAYIAAEIRSRGAHIGLVSALDILRDPRWGRAEECYSEDPYLASQMVVAAVRGLQGYTRGELKQSNKVAAVLKHFCAQGAAEGGRNAAPASIGERELREIHLPGMKTGVEAGAMGCMAAYNEIDGIPCHANRKLLTGILRNELNFKGVVMADGHAIDRLSMQTGDYPSAAALALHAGVDLSLWDKGFKTLEEALEKGKVEEAWIDRSVKRVLHLKFTLGLFDNPFTDESSGADSIGNKAFTQVNRQVARESIVLLKNKNNILPLNRKIKKVAVIGPNADQLYNQLGDYTSTQRVDNGITVLQGIRNIVSEQTEIIYAMGCGIRNSSIKGFGQAIEAAKQAEVAVLVLGGSSTRNFDIEFDRNGAALISNSRPSEMDCGEGADLADLSLGGVQSELVKKIAETGIPIIGVLIQGRPHVLTEIEHLCDAVLCGWYPGQQGGQVIGEILFGDVNPSGKLSVSMPRSSGQLPVFYNQKDMGRHPTYIDITSAPLYPFGFGLSYTSFKCSNLTMDNSNVTSNEVESGKQIEVCIDIENTGYVAGAEVLQLYIRDMEASITRRIKELKGFQKVWLEPKEKSTVTFYLGKEELGVWDYEMNYVVEPGNVRIMIGPDSDRIHEEMLLTISESRNEHFIKSNDVCSR